MALIILDVPDIDGEDILEAIKRGDLTLHGPDIYISIPRTKVTIQGVLLDPDDLDDIELISNPPGTGWGKEFSDKPGSLSHQAHVSIVLSTTEPNTPPMPVANVRRPRHWYVVWLALRMRMS